MSTIITLYGQNFDSIGGAIKFLKTILPQWSNWLDTYRVQSGQRMGREAPFSRLYVLKSQQDALFVYNKSEETEVNGWKCWPNYAYFRFNGDARQAYIYTEREFYTEIINRAVTEAEVRDALKCSYGLVRDWSGSILSASNFAISAYRAESLSDALKPRSSEWHRRFLYGAKSSWSEKVRGVYPLNILTKTVEGGHSALIDLILMYPEYGKVIMENDHAFWLAKMELYHEIKDKIAQFLIDT